MNRREFIAGMIASTALPAVAAASSGVAVKRPIIDWFHGDADGVGEFLRYGLSGRGLAHSAGDRRVTIAVYRHPTDDNVLWIYQDFVRRAHREGLWECRMKCVGLRLDEKVSGPSEILDMVEAGLARVDSRRTSLFDLDPGPKVFCSRVE